MTDTDFWAGLSAILSTILAGLFWLWNIGFLQLLFSFLTGAFTTYYIQSKLQDRIEKRRTAVENIKKIYGPFFLEIKKTKENLLLNLEPRGIGSWARIVNQSEIFCVDTNFRNQMVEFCKRAQNSIGNKINGITRIVADILYDGVKETYYPSFREEGWISFQRDGHALPGFRIELRGPGRTAFAPIEKCAILKHDPIEILQETPTFFVDQLHFVVKVLYKVDIGTRESKEYSAPISKLDPPFKHFWKDMLEKVHENPDVSRFDAERQELCCRST